MSARRSRHRPGVFAPARDDLHWVFERLLAAYGDQGWWPADTAFEVAVGAVLTQNAAWSNVEKAIERLNARGLDSPAAMLQAAEGDLADAIRPSGYFNVKARRLRHLCAFLVEQGGLERFAAVDPDAQRRTLLGVHGIGPETADDILLYALNRPVFVIDAYTRRLVGRLGWARGGEDYETLRAGFEEALGPDTALFRQYHALVVAHAKATCRKRPACDGCVLRARCPGNGVRTD